MMASSEENLDQTNLELALSYLSMPSLVNLDTSRFQELSTLSININLIRNFLLRHPHYLAQVDSNRSKHRRLGRYFESLIALVLRVQNPWSQIFNNVPIKSDSNPGELDFLIVNERSIVHLEVAVKFYLFTGTDIHNASPSDFVGPNKNDRLDVKLHKVFTKQLCHPIKVSPSLDHSIELHRQACLLGMLCYPWSHFTKGTSPKIQDMTLKDIKISVANHHAKGCWMTASQAEDCLTEFSIFRIERPYYLASHLEQIPRTHVVEIQALEIQSIDAPFFACLVSKENGRIHSRGFIVADDFQT